MPSNKYQLLYSELRSIRDNIIENAFSDAENELNGRGAPDTAYLNLIYTGGFIQRISDGARVQDLPLADRLALYPHLDQLFKLASNRQLYP